MTPADGSPELQTGVFGGAQCKASSPLSVYIHWPFCKAKCPYCDFNSHVRTAIDHTQWRQAYRQAIAFAAEMPGLAGRTVHTIFMGGGTPSLMPGQLVAAILDAVAAHWSVADDVEITLEANPTSIELANLQAYKDAGVNRVSMGIQALRDDGLRFLGREHSAAEAWHAMQMVRSLFTRASFDLIYARPEQSLAAWQSELQQALDLAPTHLSLYQLTLEPGTAFYQQAQRGDWVLPDADSAAALFEWTQHATAEAGLPAYEISNHARPGQESRHNLVYWHSDDCVGIGPGAHGRWQVQDDSCHPSTRVAGHQLKTPEAWLASVAEGKGGIAALDELDQESRAAEVVMMGLRLVTGMSRATYARLVGADIFQHCPDAAWQALVKEDLLGWDATHVWATASGRLKLNALVAYITERLDFSRAC